MKKILLVLTLIAGANLVLNAQQDTLKSRDRDWGFVLNLTGLIDNINIGNLSDANNNNAILAKHHLTDDKVLRLGLGLRSVSNNWFNQDSINVTAGRALQVIDSTEKRFDFSTENNIAFIGKGVMEDIWTGNKFTVGLLKLLSKTNILFPKKGKNIEYEIHNYPYKDEFSREVHSMNRVFFFPNEEQRFDGTALFSEKNNQIIEYLGLDQKIFFKMDLSAEANGAIRFKSGKQFLLILGMKIEIPSFLRGDIDLLEWYDDEKEKLLSSIPLGELGTPADIAKTLSFLVSAPYITGQIIYVDGGRSLHTGASA